MDDKEKSFIQSISSKNIAFISVVAIFIVLLAQSALSLFFAEPSEALAQIDIVFRTSLSSLFGYLLSVVSINGAKASKGTQPENSTQSKKIGFSGQSPADTPTAKMEGETEKSSAVLPTQPSATSIKKKKRILNYQILILAGGCVFCLLVMIFARNFSHHLVGGSSTTATLSLYRDFISASLGALIGLSKD